MDILTLVARLRDRQGGAIYSAGKTHAAPRTHAMLYDDIQAALANLAVWGVRRGMRVGIRAPNCYEWIVYDLALIELRAVSVAFTDDFAALTPDALCDRYGLSLILVSANERGRQPAERRFIAALDGDNGGVVAIDRGEPALDKNFDRPWLNFSSGSAGGLKGLISNRRGVEVNVEAFSLAIKVTPDDRLLLFLPISNFQQRMSYYAALWYGYDLIMTEPNRLFHALRDFHPTILIAPPSFYEAFETRFFNLPGRSRSITRLAAILTLKMPGQMLRKRLARRLFKDAYAMLGGEVRVMISGMAPIKRTTLDLFRLMQLPLFETYGLAECGSVSLNVPGAHRVGSVGRPLPGLEVELAEDGEIVVHREHPVTLSYFQCVEGENERTFLGGNRVASGDIGRFDRDGYLYLIGRKKELIVTAGGEKVHPEAIEAAIDACADVAKSVVFGGPHASFLAAVVLPKVSADAGARRRIEHFIDEINGGRRSMSIGKIVFTNLEFSRENGFLRPNLKLDRRRIAEHFRGELS